jgi:Flp pilus assembly protein TadD
MNPPTSIENEVDLELLMEVGFAAAGNGMLSRAVAIFQGVQAVHPDREEPLLGLAVAHIGAGAFRQAGKILADVGLRRFPKSDKVKTLLGLSLHLGGAPNEATKFFDDVINNNRDVPSVRLATNARNGGWRTIQNR